MEDVYYSLDWFLLREEVLDDSDYKCFVCGHYASVAHHLTYRYGVLCSKKWLVALCWKCHGIIHMRN
jgi:5-methylcytosine-specific restriction endonuclease McrA